MAMDSKQFAFFLLFLLAACKTTARPITVADPSGDKVSLALYYQTLCQGCAMFITDNLTKLVEDDEMMEIVDLKLVPYGNAITSNGSTTCQHGIWECFFNKMDACVIDEAPNVKEHFPFIQCLEEIIEDEYLKMGKCFDKLPGVDSDAVLECVLGDRGRELELKYAEETESLDPPHEYVPWVTVNGQPIYEDFENLIAYICEAYKGSNVPDACKSVSVKSNSSERKNKIEKCGVKESPKRAVTNVKPVIPSRIKN